MKKERSCGAVVFTRVGGALRFVLVCSRTGVYGFPKGHSEPGETPEKTALREIKEEVGLSVKLLPGFHTREEYTLPHKNGLKKQVDYFLAFFADQPIIPQPEELQSAGLYAYDEAMALFRFDSSRRVLAEAYDFLLKADKALDAL